MKLLNKTNLYFLWASMIVFCIGGILFYFLFQQIIDNDLTAKLHERKNYVVKQLAQSDDLFNYQESSANTVSIQPSNLAASATEILTDTVIFDDVDHKAISYRQLAFQVNARGKNYSVHLRRALIEPQNIIKGVIFLESFLFLAFLAILTLINNQLSKSIWKPFYATLDTINNYQLDRAENLNFPRSSIQEFNELELSIERMSTKINQEFVSQKEFIENASHEIQTPLAIVQNKMEILLQSPDLSEKELESINAASVAANRLSKINEALLILSRIENRQFHVVKDIIVNDHLEQHLNNFQELIQMKNLHVKLNFKSQLNIKMNPYLADILFENLVINAIKHNNSIGFIQVSIEERKLNIFNTGDQSHPDPSKLFKRFAKANQKSPSLGLGLSIVKAICDTYSIRIEYTYEKDFHKISLSFPTLESLQN